jgi:hypothetical protein
MPPWFLSAFASRGSHRAMDSVALNNTEGIDDVIAKLMAISPIYAKWAQSMVYTGKHFDNKSLSV